MGKPRRHAWWAALLLPGLLGASCSQVVEQYRAPTARVLPESATLAQVMESVNANSQRVTSFYVTNARLSGDGFPALRTSLAFERPYRLRMRAETALTGPELDLGSNEQEFWFWLSRSQPPALFHCRHDQFDTSQARQLFPVEPQWLIDAVGLFEFEPNLTHQGPLPGGKGRLEIRTEIPTATGPIHRRVVVDAARGCVLEQHLFAANGAPIASAIASKHRQDQLYKVTLPREIDIEWPAAQLSMHLELNEMQINYLGGDPVQLWARPNYPGYREIDLADPAVRLGPPGPAESSVGWRDSGGTR